MTIVRSFFEKMIVTKLIEKVTHKNSRSDGNIRASMNLTTNMCTLCVLYPILIFEYLDKIAKFRFNFSMQLVNNLSI